MAKTYTMQFGVGDPRTYTGLSPTFLIFVNASSGATVAPPAISEALTGSGLYKFTWGTTTPIAFLADAATTSPGAQGRYVVGQIDPADRADEYGTTIIAIGTTNFALGTTSVALGSTNVAIGTTLLGYGASSFAQGATLFGFGTTLVAIGTTNFALGTSNIALGTSSVALGTTILAGQVVLGSSLVVMGNSLAVLAVGTTLNAIGTTLLGIGSSLAGFGQTFTVVVSGIGSTASSFGTSSADPTDLFGYMKRILENLEGDSQYVKSSGLWTILDRTGGTTFIQKTITNNATLVIKS